MSYRELSGGVNAWGLGGMGRGVGRLGASLGRASGGITLAYYVAATGSDSNPGTQSQPWLTCAKVAAQSFLAGTTVYFRAGDTFTGPLMLPASNNVTYTSYNGGKATISSVAGSSGIVCTDRSNVTIDNLNIVGGGGSTGYGIDCEWLTAGTYQSPVFSNLTVSGFAASGIIAYAATGAFTNNLQVTSCTVSACTTGYLPSSTAGINVRGQGTQQGSGGIFRQHINPIISTCIVTGCTGVIGAANHTGSGIYLSDTFNGLITNSYADLNGANGNTAAGPSGIWISGCTNTVIDKCMALRTSSSGGDGGGFDIDGGCDGCSIQNSIAIGNKAFGFMCYEFDNASFIANSSNVIRNNISIADQQGCLRIVSGGTLANNGQCYNNTFVANFGAAAGIRLEKLGGGMAWTIANNNIIVNKAGTTDLIATAGNPANCLFYGNNYNVQSGTFRITWNAVTYASVALWRAAIVGQETIAAADTSKSVTPVFIGTLNVPLRSYNPEQLRPDEISPVLNAGVDMFANFAINPGPSDMYGSPLSTSGPWSIGHACMKSALKSVILTGSGNQTIPADFAQLYAVDVIATGGGNSGNSAGGGGAAFARIASTTTSLVAGVTTIPYSASIGISAANGPDAWWNASSLADAVSKGSAVCVAAEGGKTNVTATGGIGGKAVNSVGTTKFDGGNGGNNATGGNGGGGGGGGLFGNGGTGGNGGAVASTGAGGGGGANGGANGTVGILTSIGGSGGGGAYSFVGTPGGNNAGVAGSANSGNGGSGSTGGAGGAGGSGGDWSTNGSGGGGGSGVGATSATNVGGAYGGGAGGRENAVGGAAGIRFLYKTSASL